MKALTKGKSDMGQSRTALLYGVLESTINGQCDDFWDELPEDITLTEDGCVGVVVAIAYDDPPLRLPLELSEIAIRYESEIATAAAQWVQFREQSRAFGLTIPAGALFLCEVECA